MRCQRLSLSLSAAALRISDMTQGSLCGSESASHRQARAAAREGRSPLEAAWADLAARSIGVLSLNEVRDLVTRTLLTAALAHSRDNYSQAAQLLGVTRQAVQYLVNRHAACQHGADGPRQL
jgi:transcriptional regulator with GAF, ATPase, and Fis domain